MVAVYWASEGFLCEGMSVVVSDHRRLDGSDCVLAPACTHHIIVHLRQHFIMIVCGEVQRMRSIVNNKPQVKIRVDRFEFFEPFDN